MCNVSSGQIVGYRMHRPKSMSTSVLNFTGNVTVPFARIPPPVDIERRMLELRRSPKDNNPISHETANTSAQEKETIFS